MWGPCSGVSSPGCTRPLNPAKGTVRRLDRVNETALTRRTALKRMAGCAALALAATLALAGCSNESSAQTVDQGYIGSGSITWSEIPPAERAAPVLFSGETEAGEAFDSASAHGDVVVVNFWYAECPPCRAEAAALEETWQQFTGQGVQFVGINIYDQAENVKAFNKKFGVTYPSILDAAPENAKQASQAFAAAAPLQALPVTVVLDKQGRVAARYIGAIDGPSILSALVKTVLAEQ